MQHLTRWRTVTAAATTAALAAGAFGVAYAVSGGPDQPVAIEIAASGAEDVVLPQVVPDRDESPESTDSASDESDTDQSGTSLESEPSHDSDSPSEAVNSAAGQRSGQGAVAIAPDDSSFSASPSSPSSDSPSLSSDDAMDSTSVADVSTQFVSPASISSDSDSISIGDSDSHDTVDSSE